MLSSCNTWAVTDGNYNAEKLFNTIVQLFESDPEEPWCIETLKWWEESVFFFVDAVILNTKSRQVPGLSQCPKSKFAEEPKTEEYDGLDDILAARLKRRCQRDAQAQAPDAKKAKGKDIRDPEGSGNAASHTLPSDVFRRMINEPDDVMDLVDGCSSLSGSSDIEDVTPAVVQEASASLPSSSTTSVSGKTALKAGKPVKPKRKVRGRR
jgi:hypothetical protein